MKTPFVFKEKPAETLEDSLERFNTFLDKTFIIFTVKKRFSVSQSLHMVHSQYIDHILKNKQTQLINNSYHKLH